MNNLAIEDANSQGNALAIFEAPLYPKIYGPFKRFTEGELKNKLDWNNWTFPEYGYLSLNHWIWREKVDGTNIRVYWDGYNVHFGGRTNRADLPKNLLKNMAEIFEPNLFEQSFQEKKVVLYGEGFGAGIQKGGSYREEQTFCLFDVLMIESQTWLQPVDVSDVATSLGIIEAPITLVGTVWEAIDLVGDGLHSVVADSELVAEGLVGVPYLGLKTSGNSKIQMKVKAVDFYDQ